MAADGTEKQAEVSDARAARLPPIGFWSYARQDDELSFGKLSTLRSLLIHELQQQYGREQIKLFQDASTIPHGSDWEKEIQKAINASVFFVPIVTPNFIQSEWCAREVELFMAREQELFSLHHALRDRSRIFPILFIDIEDVEPENPGALAALQKLQWFDFRRFRHRSYEEAAVREALSDLAGTIRSLLKLKLAPTGADAPAVAVARESAPPPAPGAEAGAAGVRSRQIETGDVLNHIFEVKRFIKAGGMGQVFEGTNINSGERVAIKALLPALAADPKLAELFQREARTLTRLNHEALVQYLVLAKEPILGSFYIVTEYVDGVDLGEALGEVERSPAALERLLGRLASGLAVAHRLGAIHRDISPDNIMLPGGDLREAKIIDFGIAKDLGGNLPTLVGQGFAGKLNYVAPEQLGEHGGEIGPWTDVYSLALVILAVAQGAKVDMSGSFADALRKRRDGPELSSVPEALRPLLADMLRSDPAVRLRSMDAVTERLARLHAPPASPQEQGMPEPPPPRSDVEPPPLAEEPETIVVAEPPRDGGPAALPDDADGQAAEEADSPKPFNWKLLVALVAAGVVAIVVIFQLSRSPDTQPPPAVEMVTLPSGAQYQVLREGTGPTIAPDDVFLARYRVNVDGRDAPAVEEVGYTNAARPMRFGDFPPSLADALRLMRVGGQYRVLLPAGTVSSVESLDEAMNAAATGLPVYEIEIVEIVREQSAAGAAQRVPETSARGTTATRPEGPAGTTVGGPPTRAAPPPETKQELQATPARPRVNPGSLFTRADYPAAALRQGEQGSAGFRLTIEADGRVSDCRITSSSGSVSLDLVTCRILRTRARFTPARDSSGQPTVGSYNGRVVWRTPEATGD
jgi:TonB family protein